MSGEEDFLSRWTRRKAEARANPEAAAPAPEPPAAGAEAAPSGSEPPVAAAATDMLRGDPPDEETRTAWIARLEAIDLQTLTYQDDFTVFLRSWVPQALRNRALRRLWRTSDVFEVLDGLNDYDEDFSIAPAAVGAIKSSWQPGRGFAPAEETEADEQTPDGGEGPARQDQQPAPDDAGSGETTSEEVASGDDSPAEDVAAADGETATGDDAAGPGKAKA